MDFDASASAPLAIGGDATHHWNSDNNKKLRGLSAARINCLRELKFSAAMQYATPIWELLLILTMGTPLLLPAPDQENIGSVVNGALVPVGTSGQMLLNRLSYIIGFDSCINGLVWHQSS